MRRLSTTTSDETRESICRDIRLGFSIREAASAAGVAHAAIRQAISRGGRATRGGAFELAREVRRAQSDYRRQVAAATLLAAKRGVPAALQRLYDRADAMSVDLAPEPPEDPVEFLRFRLAEVRARMEDATGIAYNQLLAREDELIRRLDALKREDPPSPADLLAALSVDVQGWSDAELLAVHAEGLARGIPGFVPR